jgi:hypothetical protein
MAAERLLVGYNGYISSAVHGHPTGMLLRSVAPGQLGRTWMSQVIRLLIRADLPFSATGRSKPRC